MKTFRWYLLGLVALLALVVVGAAYAGPNYDAETCSAIDASGATGVTLVNGGAITNNVDGSLAFSESGETISLDYTNNAVAMTSSTGVSTFTFSSITPVAAAMTLNGTLTMANSETISNGTNGQIKLAANGKNDLIFDLGQTTTNRIALSSTAGTNLDFGTVVPTFLRPMIAGGAAYTVAFATDCNGIVTTATDTAVITLPNITAGSIGCPITVVNTATSGANALVSVVPDGSDYLVGSCPSGDMGAGAGKQANNTKATHVKGDSITLVSDGTSAWIITGCTGIWAHN